MGCGSCGTKGADGKPSGCKSNGGCSSGGCNRMNVHDWLRNLPFSDPESNCRVIEVSFKQGSRKEFFRNTTLQYFEKGDLVTVEGVSGYDVGEVSLTGELVRLQMKKMGVAEDSPEMKKILRRSHEKDIESYQYQKSREQEVLARSRAIARQLNLQMKLSEVEIQADGKKATFFYTADDRVDFREMIKIFAGDFKLKVEMRQIGIRQEAAKVGGIGSCGRELCCSTWLHDFKSVNTTAARYQNLSINQTKLSGQCGRLKCCLNYELDTYLDALQHFPNDAEVLEVQRGRAILIKKDIFKNLMWYILPDNNKQYPLTIERVREIRMLNRQGQQPDELGAVELVGGKPKAIEPQFVDVVGQISLRSLERTQQRKRNEERRGQHVQQRQQQPRPNNKPGQPMGNRPPQGNQDGGKPQPPRNEQRPPQQRPQQGGQGGGRPPHNGPHKRPPQSGRPQGNKPGGNGGNKPPQSPSDHKD
ncbi:MAG TPA: hypothetical protein DCQ29_07290 [Chitinophagaceae bacterium]|nr:hypothetical protein [Chitinophagaceae bacterium]